MLRGSGSAWSRVSGFCRQILPCRFSGAGSGHLEFLGSDCNAHVFPLVSDALMLSCGFIGCFRSFEVDIGLRGGARGGRGGRAGGEGGRGGGGGWAGRWAAAALVISVFRQFQNEGA